MSSDISFVDSSALVNCEKWQSFILSISCLSAPISDLMMRQLRYSTELAYSKISEERSSAMRRRCGLALAGAKKERESRVFWRFCWKVGCWNSWLMKRWSITVSFAGIWMLKLLIKFCRKKKDCPWSIFLFQLKHLMTENNSHNTRYQHIFSLAIHSPMFILLIKAKANSFTSGFSANSWVRLR